MKLLPTAFSLLFVGACAQVRIPFISKKADPTQVRGYAEYEASDYIRHLAAFEGTFLRSRVDRELRLQGRAKEYLDSLAATILQNNELFFEGNEKPRIHVVRDEIPYHFSLPGKVIFVSTALVNKYVKHESILASIICYELIRSEKNLYNRSLIVPVGYMPLTRILGFNRLDADEKLEIHKWAYYSIRRAGYDGEYYLSWLQTINRNTADFMPLIGDASSISREEAMFKAFMIRRSKLEDGATYSRRDSSKEFYQFLFFIKDKSA